MNMEQYHVIISEAMKMASAFLWIQIFFGLLNCFFGYKLLKVWMATCGFFLGVGIGFLGGSFFIENRTIVNWIAIGSGILLAIIAYEVYLLGAFFLGWVLTVVGIGTLGKYLKLAPKMELVALILGALLGIAVGALIVKYARPSIIVATGISGGLSASIGIFSVLSVSTKMVMLAVAVGISLLGIMVQFFMTRDRIIKKSKKR